MTDPDGQADRICDLYARRMGVEEMSRNGKCRRNGRALRIVRIGRPDRHLLAVTPAYVLPAGQGLAAKLDCDPSA